MHPPVKTLNPLFVSKRIIKGKIVVVNNLESNISTVYNSISEASLALNITRVTLRSYIKSKKIFLRENYYNF